MDFERKNEPRTIILQDGDMLHGGPSLDSDIFPVKGPLPATAQILEGGCWQKVTIDTTKEGKKPTSLTLYQAMPENNHQSPRSKNS